MMGYAIALKSRAYFMQTNGMSSLILVLSKLTIAMTSMLFAFLLLLAVKDLELPLFPLLVVLVATYFIAG